MNTARRIMTRSVSCGASGSVVPRPIFLGQAANCSQDNEKRFNSKLMDVTGKVMQIAVQDKGREAGNAL